MPQIAPPSAQGAPSPGAGGGAPMGTTSAATPTPNRGGEAAALQVLANIATQLSHAMTQAGATSELGGKIHKILGDVIKLAPPGTSSPAGQKNVMDQAQMRNSQQNQMAQALRQQMMQRQAGAGGGAGGGAGLPGMAA